MFTDLEQLREGDVFYIHVLGEVLAYQVFHKEAVLPHDTSLLGINHGEDIVLNLVLPYHPAERPIEAPAGYDGTYYPEGLEKVPRQYAIVRANKIMVDTSDWLIAYVRHGASNSRKLLEYAQRREKKGLIQIINLSEENSCERNTEVEK